MAADSDSEMPFTPFWTAFYLDKGTESSEDPYATVREIQSKYFEQYLLSAKPLVWL